VKTDKNLLDQWQVMRPDIVKKLGELGYDGMGCALTDLLALLYGFYVMGGGERAADKAVEVVVSVAKKWGLERAASAEKEMGR
jgi:hypothetical protein